MANCCMYDIKIAGKAEAVQEFMQMLSHQGPYKRTGFGGVFSFEQGTEPIDYGPAESGLIAVTGSGDCAWSVKSSMTESKPYNLESECKRLGLVVEVYSSEPGCCFQEHFLCKKGDLELEECIPYKEWFVEGMDHQAILKLAKEKHLTVETLKSRVDCNGLYTEGGYKDEYGRFGDLFTFFEEEKFIFDDELLICNDSNNRCINGYLWAVDALVEPLKAQEARHLTVDQLDDMENINFYPDYDVRHNSVSISGSYYIGDEHFFFELPVSEEDSRKLIDAMERYCQKIIGCSCVEAVDKVRAENNLGSIAVIRDLEQKLQNAESIEYKGIVFDEWTIDEEHGNIYGEMCQCCADKYKDLLKDELSAGGMGACSVKGCNIVGADSDYERHYYVDFKPELIKAIERKPSLDSLCAGAAARCNSSETPQLQKDKEPSRD